MTIVCPCYAIPNLLFLFFFFIINYELATEALEIISRFLGLWMLCATEVVNTKWSLIQYDPGRLMLNGITPKEIPSKANVR